MAKYLISFPSAAMVVPDRELEAVDRDAHAVISEAKAAGVYVFGGGIDEAVPPILVSADRSVAEGGYSWAPQSTAVLPFSNCHRARRPSFGPRALRAPADVSRSSVSSDLIRSPESSTEGAFQRTP